MLNKNVVAAEGNYEGWGQNYGEWKIKSKVI